MSALYCFKLNEETGEVIKITISPEEFEAKTWTNNKKYWRFKLNNQIMYCYEQNLDMFKNSKVYSFNDDIEAAKKIICQTISDRKTKAEKDLKRYSTLLKKMDRCSP